MSKLRKSIILLMCFMIAVSSALYFYKTNQVKNVFDEIYFAEFNFFLGKAQLDMYMSTNIDPTSRVLVEYQYDVKKKELSYQE